MRWATAGKLKIANITCTRTSSMHVIGFTPMSVEGINFPGLAELRVAMKGVREPLGQNVSYVLLLGHLQTQTTQQLQPSH